VVLREPSKAKSVARVSGDNFTAGNSASTGDLSTEKEKKGVSLFVTDEIYSTILDVSFKNAQEQWKCIFRVVRTME